MSTFCQKHFYALFFLISYVANYIGYNNKETKYVNVLSKWLAIHSLYTPWVPSIHLSLCLSLSLSMFRNN